MVRIIHCCAAVSWASRRLLLLPPSLAVQASPLSLQSCCRRRISVSLPRHALCFSAGPLADEPLQENISFKPTKRDALESGLYLVATPIGNLEDITLRALRVLKSANLILSEDTRHSGKLLQHYNIKTPLLSYHKFNESQRGTLILQKLQQGEIIALISDAGTPGISDPGEQLTKLCVHNKIRVFPIPGPCAVVAALSASGLSTDEFTFVGFLSKHAGSRRQRLLISSSEAATQIFYVPPHKIQAFLDEVTEIFSTSRNCVIAREMTKVHEEFWRGTLGEAKEAFSSYQPKGEITILVEGKRDSAAEVPSEAEIAHDLRELVSNGHSLSMAVKMVSESTTVKRKSVYSLALKIFGDKTELPKQISSEKDQHSERYSLRHSVSEWHVDAAVEDKLAIRTWSCYPRFLRAFRSLKIQREASQSSMLMDKKGDVLRMDLLMVPTSNQMRLRWTSVTVRSPCPMGRTTPCVNQNWIFCLGTIQSPISANVRLQQATIQ